MEEVIENIIENIWVQLGGYIVGFVGLVIGIYSLKKKYIKPVYIKRSTTLLQEHISNLDGLKIEYDNNPVRNLTITNIAIWNAGKKTLNQSDVSVNELISIKPKGGILVYRYSVLKVSNSSNGINVQTNAGSTALEIDFEYMDNNEGVAIQLIHSGSSSTDIDVFGSIKGFGRIKSHESEFKTEIMTNMLESPVNKLRPNKEDKKGIFKFLIIVSCILLGLGFFAPPIIMSIILGIHGLIYMIFAFTFKSVTKTPADFEFIEH